MQHKKLFLIAALLSPWLSSCGGKDNNGNGNVTPAAVSLAKTGQTTCEDSEGATIDCANTGQDGDLQTGVSWPNPRFTADSSGDCMTDNLTGLTWVKASGPAYTWQEALDHANNLNLCGATDWRLPNRKELRSLVNTGASNLAWLLDQGFLASAGDHWTSTTVAGSPTEAWMMIVINGVVYPEVKSAQNVVWPVRGGQ